MTQILQFWFEEGALAQFAEEEMSAQAVKHGMQMPSMLFRSGGMNQNIIHIDHTVGQATQNVIHDSLECGRGVGNRMPAP